MASKILMSCCRRLSTFRQRSHQSSINNAAAMAGEAKSKVRENVDMSEVCIPLGIALTALTFGAYTATGLFSSSPSVRLNKKLRGTVPEVEQPEQVAHEGSRYVNRSFFRKVARHEKSLKSSGVDR